MRYPENKKTAQALESEGIAWGCSPELGKNIMRYLKDLGQSFPHKDEKGADRAIVQEVNRYHRRMSVENVHFPKEIPFEIVYSRFMSAVLNGMTQLSDYQPYLVSNQLKAFKSWVTSPGMMQSLLESYYELYPNAKPKQISSGTETRLEKWTDGEIQDQRDKIHMIFGEIKNIPMFKTGGAQSYFGRIEQEYKKRFNEPTTS